MRLVSGGQGGGGVRSRVALTAGGSPPDVLAPLASASEPPQSHRCGAHGGAGFGRSAGGWSGGERGSVRSGRIPSGRQRQRARTPAGWTWDARSFFSFLDLWMDLLPVGRASVLLPLILSRSPNASERQQIFRLFLETPVRPRFSAIFRFLRSVGGGLLVISVRIVRAQGSVREKPPRLRASRPPGSRHAAPCSTLAKGGKTEHVLNRRAGGHARAA